MNYSSTMNSSRPWPIIQQKRDIKASLSKAVGAGQLWEPIQINWFRAWKQYVAYDNEGEDTRTPIDIASQHPGELDNSCLQGSYGDELSRNIQEGVDFVLVDASIVERLYKEYNKISANSNIIRFSRSTINTGTTMMPVYQIRLYPIRYESSLYDKSCAEGKEAKISYYKNVVTLRDLKREFESESRFKPKSGGYNNYNTPKTYLRLWIKQKAAFSDLSDADNNDASSVITSKSDQHAVSDVKEVETSLSLRYITLDKTKTVDNWRLMDSDLDVKCEDLMTERNCVEVMVEALHISSSSSYSYGYSTALSTPSAENWPRYPLLSAWINHLARGDVIDSFRKNAWYESIVKYITFNDDRTIQSIHVHYATFDETLDDTILSENFKQRIAPLYSHTKNWKLSIEEDDFVDVKIGDVWVQGVVEEIDTSSNSIKVCYNSAMVEYTKRTIIETASNAKAESEVLSTSDIAVSEVNSFAAAAGSQRFYKRSDNIHVGSTTRSTYSEKVSAPIKDPDVPLEPIMAWFSLSQESVAMIHTHTSLTNKSQKFVTAKADLKMSYASSEESSIKGKPPSSGAVGLQNIRNTCYMNSMLQCLSHTIIKDIFLGGSYRSQLNRTNPTGFGGRVAKQFAQLMKDIYSGNYSVVVPRNFKTVIGQCWQQFSGFDQQDSQELMGYLLDGLHEDLNRIIAKPYVPTIQSYSGVSGPDDDHLARDTWRRHLLRHDSLFTECVYGLTRSQVTCRNCNRDSITFEPYHCLSLPVPNTAIATKPLRVLVKMLADSVPFEVDVPFNIKTGTSAGVLEATVKRLVELNIIEASREQLESIESIKKRRKTCAINDRFWHLFKQNNKLTNAADVCKGDERTHLYHASYDRYYLVEIDEDAPPIEEVRTSKPWNHMSSKTSMTASSLEDSDEVVQPTSFCALYAGKRKINNEYCNDIETFDLPISLCFEKGVTTNLDIYSKVLNYAKRFISKDYKHQNDASTIWDQINSVSNLDVDFFSSLPFEVCSVNWNGQFKYSKVEINRNLFRLASHEHLCVLFKLGFTGRVEYPKKYELKQEATDASTSSSGALTLQNCLQKHLVQEKLPESETYYCNGCKEHLSPIKKLDIWSTPDVLIIHLKRFHYATSQYSNNVIREKITDMIEYPVKGLDLSPYMLGPKHAGAPPIYDLTGVSLHSGSLYGGHYTAFAKDENTDSWFYYNDSRVSRVTSMSELVSSQAYVLFYKRRTGTLKWAGMVPTSGPDVIVTPDDQAIIDKEKAKAAAAMASK